MSDHSTALAVGTGELSETVGERALLSVAYARHAVTDVPLYARTISDRAVFLHTVRDSA